MQDFTDTSDFSEDNIVDINLFPNPVSLNSVVNFYLKENSDVFIQILDVSGRVVRNFGRQQILAGANTFSLENIYDLPSGNYILYMELNGGSRTFKFVK